MMIAALLACDTPHDRLLRVIDALSKHKLEVVLIDNGSIIPLEVPNVRTFRLDPCGIIHGRNFGFTLRRKGDSILVMADDVIVPEGHWEDIMMSNDAVLAMRPADDWAFRSGKWVGEDILVGAPTSFQCVHFPGKILDEIGYVDERYIWGDDGLMMRKASNIGVLKHYTIEVEMRRLRSGKYQAMREFYEELWRPGKMDGFDRIPIRHDLEYYNEEWRRKCPTIWTMDRRDDSDYYDVSSKIREMFGRIWSDPSIDRVELLKELIEYEDILRSREKPSADK